MERFVLIFAYHFPPENVIGGARPYRFYKYLSRLGYRCHVITAAKQPSRPDNDFEYVADPLNIQPRQGIGWQAERMIRRILLPGGIGIRWSRMACQAAQSFVRLHPNAEMTILSTYPPLGAHLAAFRLTRRSGLKWIADFRDPLGNNPSHTYLKEYQQKLYRWLEQIIVKTADEVIVNTDAVAEALTIAYPNRRDHIQLIWNGFDPEDRIRALPLPQRDYQILSHIGELYDGRNVTALLESFARLIGNGRLLASRIRVRLVGAVHKNCLPQPEFLHRASTAGWLEFIPDRIPYREALAMVQSSDGLLLVQPHSTLQVPGKLFEYLQIGRPVLAFVLPDSPIERILKQSGVPYRCVYAEASPQEMDDAVEEFFRLKPDPSAPSAWFEHTFDAKRQTQVLENIIRSIQ
jgi:glycosyltransferase involved in cell wall biosynthesis